MIDVLTAHEWMAGIEDAAREVATTALGFSDCSVNHGSSALPLGLSGAYLPLGGGQAPMQVGLLSDVLGCQLLAKALLAMDPAEEDLAAADMGDALSEILNMLAGGLKRRVSPRVDITLGLPLFLNGGTVQSNAHVSVLTAGLRLGSAEAFVLLATAKSALPRVPAGAAHAPAPKKS